MTSTAHTASSDDLGNDYRNTITLVTHFTPNKYTISSFCDRSNCMLLPNNLLHTSSSLCAPFLKKIYSRTKEAVPKTTNYELVSERKLVKDATIATGHFSVFFLFESRISFTFVLCKNGKMIKASI